MRNQLAEKIAAEKGIKYKSAMRYIQRAVAPEGKQRIINPTFSGLKKSTVSKAKRIIKETKAAKISKPEIKQKPREILYPREVGTGAHIKCADVRNPLANSTRKGEIVAITANFVISRDAGKRRIRLFITPDELAEIKKAGSLYDAIATWTNSVDGYFLQDASISDFEKMEIL